MKKIIIIGISLVAFLGCANQKSKRVKSRQEEAIVYEPPSFTPVPGYKYSIDYIKKAKKREIEYEKKIRGKK